MDLAVRPRCLPARWVVCSPVWQKSDSYGVRTRDLHRIGLLDTIISYRVVLTHVKVTSYH